MDAKTLAADIRTAVRAATRTPGDPLHALTICVRTEYASLMSAVTISVRDVAQEELMLPADQRHPGQGWATERAQAISDRLHELAGPALDWQDGRHAFCTITVGGILAPPPSLLPADEPELCELCFEVLGACDCAAGTGEYEARSAAERADTSRSPAPGSES